MQRLFLVISLLFAGQSLWAQEQEHEWAIFDFYVGASIPLGKFAQKDLQEGGYAQTGFALGVGPNWYINRNWGVFFHLGYQSNTVDSESLERDALEELPNVNSLSYDGGDYASFLAMVGPSYTFRLTDRFRWIVKIGAGLFTSFQSDVNLTVDGSTVILKSDSRFKFSGYAATSLSYDVSKKIAILAHADFSDANPEYKLRLGDFDLGSQTQRQTYANIGAGVSIRLE